MRLILIRLLNGARDPAAQWWNGALACIAPPSTLLAARRFYHFVCEIHLGVMRAPPTFPFIMLIFAEYGCPK